MTQTTDDLPGFEQRLLSELRQVVEDQQPMPAGASTQLHGDRLRRRTTAWRFLVPAAALAVLAAVAGPSFVVPGSSGSTAFALETLPGGRIHVVLASDFDESERLEAELAAAGVDVQPVTITAAPALVGTIEILPLGTGGQAVATSAPAGLELGDGEFWIDPERYDGSVEILVYVAPAPGERWQQAPSIFHPDQPLGGLTCSTSGSLTSATVEEVAGQVGIERITWMAEAGDPTGDEMRIEASQRRPDGEVVAASLSAPGELQVLVRPTGLVERFGSAGRPSMSLNLHSAGEPPCTPELAARW